MSWTTEIEEISNNVYRLRMLHQLGVCIEKIGSDIDEMKKEALLDSVRIEKEIKDKIEKTNHNKV